MSAREERKQSDLRFPNLPAGQGGREGGAEAVGELAPPPGETRDPGGCVCSSVCRLRSFWPLSRPCCILHLLRNRWVSGGRKYGVRVGGALASLPPSWETLSQGEPQFP